MFQFFDFIVNCIETIFGFLVNVADMLIYVCEFIIQGFGYIVGCFLFMPAWVLPFVMAVISFSVIMFIINR